MVDFRMGDTVSIDNPLIKATGFIETDEQGKWIVVFPYEPTKYSNGKNRHAVDFDMVKDCLEVYNVPMD